MLELKKGVKLDGLQSEMIPALRAVDHCCAAMGIDAVITSAVDGKHGAGSLHPKGYAIDIRTKHIERKAKKAERDELIGLLALRLIAYLGDDYDVVVEKTHIHVEYDPKIGGARFFALGKAGRVE